MLLKQWPPRRAEFHNGRSSYVRTLCPDALVVDPARQHVHADSGRCGLFARLACLAKCLPKPHRPPSACGVYERSRHSVDWGRVFICHTRSSIAHGAHAETPSVDDGRCTAPFSGRTRFFVSVRATKAIHQGPSLLHQRAEAMARKLSSVSGAVLAGGHSGNNRVASSRGISVGHAVARDSYFGRPVFSFGRAPILVAGLSVFTKYGELAWVVHSFVPLPRHAALRHPFSLPGIL